MWPATRLQVFFRKTNRDGTFTDLGLEAGVALNDDGMEQAGMGLGIGDFNFDGSLDIFKTHFSDDTNILYRNDGKWNFTDVTISSGLGVEIRFTGWGASITMAYRICSMSPGSAFPRG